MNSTFHPGSTYNPVSSYRIQFNGDFTFGDAEKIVPYLQKSGIRTIYASPVFQAAEGSDHGYDVTDPHQLNGLLGDEKAWNKLLEKLRSHGIGWIQDVVPNHMSYSPENPWIYDLLRKGKDSLYFPYFDLFSSATDPVMNEKLLLPFLGEDLETTIANHSFTLVFNEQGFMIKLYDVLYPVSSASFEWVLQKAADPGSALAADISRILEVTTTDPDERTRQFFSLFQADQEFRDYVEQCLEKINVEPPMMHQLVNLQYYLPVFWQETEQKINYRRFFSINGLICINMQDQEVFTDYHQLIFRWIAEDKIQGLRIDHIDGLNDPSAYLARLRENSNNHLYIVVEKILEENEMLPETWPVQGTTGYDFLALVNNLLTNDDSGSEFQDFLKEWGDDTRNYDTLAIRKKRFFLENRFQGELNHLFMQCKSIGATVLKDITNAELKNGIAEFLVHFPVYRMYSVPSEFSRTDLELIREVFSNARRSDPDNNRGLSALEELITSRDGKVYPGKRLSDNAGEKNNPRQEVESSGLSNAIDSFFSRCMQFTGPIMAKGIEDTLFYTYHPLLAHNEVGDSPRFFGIKKEQFHRSMSYRLDHWPMAMNTTSTHDTKRGEDARARLNVLSDLPERWMDVTRTWRKINKSFLSKIEGGRAPSGNDEYFIYQSLVAHLPMTGAIDNDFTERFKEFIIKAIREAKLNTSWSEPVEDYEKGTLKFIDAILTLETDFLGSLYQFVKEIKIQGMINSLVQLTLKHTVPGVPDTFQGNETWNLDFVDPDNRKPVNYSKLSRSLTRMLKESEKDKKKLLLKLWNAPENGGIKQWIHHLLLEERSQHESLYLKGSYTPLKIKGAAKDHVIAYHRKFEDEHLVVILPLNLSALAGEGWKNTRVKLPGLSPDKWSNLLTGEVDDFSDSISVSTIFKDFPLAVLKGIQHTPSRKSGILMHISSLPGDFGIGDFGPGAKQFIDFLHRTGQRYWQILPLSVAEKATAYSPYSSASAFAGNDLFIDPYKMVRDGLLKQRILKNWKSTPKNRVKYKSASRAKQALISKAFKRFRKSDNIELLKQYQAFLSEEQYWLEDFALFSCLRHKFNDQPWNKWPEEYRNRDPRALKDFSKMYKEELDSIRFRQFLFSQHWLETRKYANDRGIKIFGDIPIYVDFHSADVWAHQELFMLDNKGRMTAVAGVPPDYFNQEGQHWGMPLFNWKEMEKEKYHWWLKRIEKNLQWFDLLRLDHFRGFSAYWKIPAEAESAVLGTWETGPGRKLFNAIQKKFPDMPFIAEDLGLIDKDVYDLRDHYGLPGMNVIQFGFGKNMPSSEHNPLNIPHNAIVYTGTHDNNTIRGWYRHEADRETLKRIRRFHGVKLSGTNAHLEMIRVAYATQAKLVIIPMQDWLGLNEKSRMNFPSTTVGNWKWKLAELPRTDLLEKKIISFGKTFGRF